MSIEELTEQYILDLLTALGQMNHINGKVSCIEHPIGSKPITIPYFENDKMSMSIEVRRELLHRGWKIIQEAKKKREEQESFRKELTDLVSGRKDNILDQFQQQPKKQFFLFTWFNNFLHILVSFFAINPSRRVSYKPSKVCKVCNRHYNSVDEASICSDWDLVLGTNRKRK